MVLAFKALMPGEAWDDWGWRVPFLFSILLLAISLWMRLKLSESPVFQAMKAAGETRAATRSKESFTYPGNLKRMFVALFGIAAGLTVIWYTAMFSVLSFLQGPMRVEETAGAADRRRGGASMGLVLFICFGQAVRPDRAQEADRLGLCATLVLLFPLFWVMGARPIRGWRARRERAPVDRVGPRLRL